MENEFCMVLTTVNSEPVKKSLIDSLLERRLAACIQAMPIQSHFLWEGKVCEDSEYLLIIKTRKAIYAQVEAHIIHGHNYEVPQIVQVPFTGGLDPYLHWLKESTS